MSDKDVFVTGRKDENPDERLEHIIERELRSTGYPSRGRIFASSAGLCERQTAGLMLLPDDHEDERKASTQFYFAIGSTVEDVVERALQRGGVWLDSETRVESMIEELPISGRIDFVIRDPLDDQISLVELKTCGKLPTEPRHHHKAQLMTYLLLTGMPRGFIWYVSRHVSDWTGDVIQRTFEIRPTDRERSMTASRIARGAIFGAAKKLPAIPEHMRKYKCGFCPLIPMCWDDEDVGLGEYIPTISETKDLLLRADDVKNELLKSQKELRSMFEDEFA